MQLRPVRRLNEDFLHRGKTLRDVGAARLRQRLPVEDQRVLRKVDDQRERDEKREDARGNDLEDRRDQVL